VLTECVCLTYDLLLVGADTVEQLCVVVLMLMKSREVRTEATGLAGVVQSVYALISGRVGLKELVRIYSGRRQRVAAEMC
jgi:hypothetical protein